MDFQLDQLIKQLCDDCEKEHGFRPMVDDKHKQAIEKAQLHFPFKIRRMWNLYIRDNEEIERGIGFGYFTRDQILNRYAARVPREPQKSGIKRGNLYFCENRARPLKEPGIHCGNAGVWLDTDIDCRPEPCGQCGGKMLRKDLYEKLRETFLSDNGDNEEVKSGINEDFL